ncbi:outer membrane beta-barrel protein [Halorhodospira halophila]|uniref:Outer membrane protein beta-barrel domain-containing protein n=1 Tax=Halorhodospira halophila (strain DSM 244 / SL1) TaxID=349124 RepID=A1WY11_HALHL|nr:outer membrane beta-barrel protein [Halorhodospira halophila]ABM62573.1 hypothetical protein Hhal_1809 [Halorhodospira halophila SL1]MBK1728252.1 hypothetical protein [Halorhodospira halophila]
MRNKLTVALAGGALATGAFVGQASAQMPADTGNFNYNYAEGALVLQDRDSQDLVGPRAKGSVAFTRDIFGVAELNYLTDDVDITDLRAGAGYRLGVAPELDFYGVASLVYQDFDNDFDDTGLGITLGTRYAVMADFEIAGEIRHTNMDDFDSTTDLAAQFLYGVAPNVELLGELQLLDDGDDMFEDTGLALGARYNF